MAAPTKKSFSRFTTAGRRACRRSAALLGADGIWILVTYLQVAAGPGQHTDAIVGDRRARRSGGSSACAAPAAPAATGAEGLLTKYVCSACHAVGTKLVGPAFKDVAAKYRDSRTPKRRWLAKVKNGGAGVWGPVPMPPNAGVPDEDLHAMIKWILALK